MIISNFTVYITTYTILSTGVDGGHKYISTEIKYNDEKRKLTAFFASKTDELSLVEDGDITLSGNLLDEGLQQSLLLLEAKIIAQ